MPLRKRIESFQRKPYFLRVNNDLNHFRGKSTCIIGKNLGHKLVLVTDILQSNASLAYKLNSVFCVFLTTATIL